MSATNEYFPSPNEPTNGNGNGNGHGKIFSLKPATDPDTLLILDTRRNALAEPKHRLTRSAKACFCEILDRSLHPGFFDVKGVVTISDTILAGVFSVSNRSIYSWKRMIEAAGYVWTSQKWKSNMWPLTTYHVSCLHKKPINGKTDQDGTYGGGKLRPAPVNPGLGCRKPGQPVLPLPGSRTTAPETENAVLQGISAQTGNPLRLSAEENFGSEPKPASGESRSQLRARAEENFGSEPKPASGESRRNLRARPEANCEHLETQIGGSVGEEPLEAINRLGKRAKAAEGGKPPRAARRAPESENDFMVLCMEVFGKREMIQGGPQGEGNGGLWRTLYRQNSSKALRVLLETRMVKKDTPHILKTTWAAYAMDLWKHDRVGV